MRASLSDENSLHYTDKCSQHSFIPKAADRRVAVPRPRRPALPGRRGRGTAPLYALNFGLALPLWWRLRIASARNRRSWRGRVRATVRSRANGRARSNGRTCSKCVRMLPNPSALHVGQPNRDAGEQCSKNENSSKCFKPDRTCASQIEIVTTNCRKCVQMLHKRSKLRQPNQDCSQK